MDAEQTKEFEKKVEELNEKLEELSEQLQRSEREKVDLKESNNQLAKNHAKIEAQISKMR